MLHTATGLLLAGGLAAARLHHTTRNYYRGPVHKAYAAGVRTHRREIRPGAVLHYARTSGTGRPGLLLIPGQGSLWHDYAKVLPDLSADFDVVAVDVHGHGGSSRNRADYCATVIAADLVLLGRELFDAPFLVAGHSSGGLIAVQMAAGHPGDIAGVLIEDAPFFATDPNRVPGTFVGQDLDLLAGYLAQAEKPDGEEDYLAHALPGAYIGTLFGDLWPFISGRVIAQRRQHPQDPPNIWYLGPAINRIWESISHPFDRWWSHAFFISRSWHRNFDQATALRSVTAPTTFLKAGTSYGADGVLLAALTDEDLARVEKLLVDNRTVHVRAGHDIHFEKPAVFTRALRELAERSRHRLR
ncbi:alpha/beta hydrolase [Corynebacterium sp. YIM 101645]|uniref:Alpha/beta hydrolase n=1 Tax=Corynebacterium lemuris TaxID=1859292 RepID=A0ABT2FWP3_9CORY|nr:alpha/beta hydrolase [Corynebacterium lemuris]MCS5478908.1 alpha/beta hydrolase [Corynebacterium lemuris]